MLIIIEVILICCLLYKSNRNEVIMVTNFKSIETKNEYNQLLVNTYLTRIEEASNHFYGDYYTTLPVVDYYNVFIKDITSDNDTYYITFTSKPYLGPHDTIGIDEITFSADWQGNIKLNNFIHIISYPLPDNLKDLEKK